MNSTTTRELARRFREQHGVASRAQLYALGIDSRATRRRISAGEWEAVGSKVIRLAGFPPTPEQRLLAACLTAGPASVASHASAAWLWELSEVPARLSITIPRSRWPRGLEAFDVQVHRPQRFPEGISWRKRIPCTKPLRTILDLAGAVAPEDLDDVLDRAFATKLVGIAALGGELARAGGQGRPGTQALRAALNWRTGGNGAGIPPSVLESRTLRLLQSAGITPLSVEVKYTELTYRVDILLRPGLAMEVDGHAYHNSAAQMAEDARRRNRLFLAGITVLVYTWRDIVHDGQRVLAEVISALGSTG
jgi:very-short-patch-repair endonuclease